MNSAVEADRTHHRLCMQAMLISPNPDRYMILDVRAKWSLGEDDRADSVRLWIEYTDHVRALARSLGVSLRTLDRALWEYAKRNPHPRKQEWTRSSRSARSRTRTHSPLSRLSEVRYVSGR